jgi:RNA polymerase sigma-70 factor (ECF subfamily)
VNCYIHHEKRIIVSIGFLGSLTINYIKGMKKGDSDSFEQCYRELSPAIYSAILRICMNRDTANDLLHDTFIIAFEKIETFNEKYQFIAWIKRIAFNRTFNYLKKSSNRSHQTIENFDALSPIKSAEQTLLDTNLLDTLFVKVSETERLVLWLFIVEQYTHDEISDLVGKSASYSKSIVSRSLKKLKQDHEEEPYEIN